MFLLTGPFSLLSVDEIPGTGFHCQAWLCKDGRKTVGKGSEVELFLGSSCPSFPIKGPKGGVSELSPQQGWGGPALPALPGRSQFLNWFIYFLGPFLIFLINSLVRGTGKFISSCYHSNQLSCTGYCRKCVWGLLKELGLQGSQHIPGHNG